VKKLTGDFDNGLGAVLIGERSLASFLSKKLRENISGLFQQYRPTADSQSEKMMQRSKGRETRRYRISARKARQL
jgi:hypothetical protein